jgi:hypothetical protein
MGLRLVFITPAGDPTTEFSGLVRVMNALPAQSMKAKIHVI